jgi:hypothetical protein
MVSVHDLLADSNANAPCRVIAISGDLDVPATGPNDEENVVAGGLNENLHVMNSPP